MSKPIMISLDDVAAIVWSKAQGQRLQSLRQSQKITRLRLYELLIEQSISCTPQNLQKIETGKAKTVPIETLKGVCNTLKISLITLLLSANQPSNDE
jgi:DNA-binding Xre family transcriptional regulator